MVDVALLPTYFCRRDAPGILGGLRVKVDRARDFSVPCCIVQKSVDAILFDTRLIMLNTVGEKARNTQADPLASESHTIE